MVKIAAGELYYAHLPEAHPIKAFCRKNKITSPTVQHELTQLVEKCLALWLDSMVNGETKKSIEDCEKLSPLEEDLINAEEL